MTRPRVVALTLIVSLYVGPLASAQEPPQQSQVKTRWVRSDVESAGRAAPQVAVAGLGDRITLNVRYLDQLLEKQKGYGQPILYINGLPLKGLYPEAVGNPKDTLRFHLQRTPESRAAWVALLGKPRALTKPVRVTVGLENGTPPTDQGAEMQLTVTRRPWVIGWFVFAAFILGALVLLAMFTNLLRDSDAVTETKPFSLGRTQLAFWSFLALLAYVFIWMVTGDLDSLTASVLGLIGISSAAAVGAAVVDVGKENTRRIKEENRATDVQVTAATPAGAPAAVDVAVKVDPANDATKPAGSPVGAKEHVAVVVGGPPAQAFAASPPPVRTRRQANFILDLISDSHGVSLHRFQFAMWTVVVGVIFIRAVYESLSMPEFSATLLGLMGISSATYVGLKAPAETKPLPDGRAAR